MKLDEQLDEVLNNFAQINPGIQFKPGNVVSTIKPSGAVLAKATVNEQFDSTFTVYDLHQLLAVLSQCENPDVTIMDNHMMIKVGSDMIRFNLCDPDLIATPPQKNINFPSIDVSFTLTNETLARLKKFAAIMGSKQIACEGDGTNVYLVALDIQNSAANTFKTKVGKTDKTFRLVFMYENFVFLPREYEVEMSKAGLAHLKSNDVEYWVAAENKESNFQE